MDTILLGRGKDLVRTSRREWEDQLVLAPRRISSRLDFVSEEHARGFRAATEQVDGTYLTLGQSVHSTRIVQGALFGF